MAELIPLFNPSKAYSSVTYIQADEIITFEVSTNRTSINKGQFCTMLGLDSFEGLVDWNSISSTDLVNMFYHMVYIVYISLLSKFRKPNLPPMWNELFTLLFKSFSKRVAGLDNASKLFCTIIYGLYHGTNMDYGSILWTQPIQSTASSSSNSRISCTRFWSIVVKRALVHFKVPISDDLWFLQFRSFVRRHSWCLTP